jgi:hypothetical protein
MHELSAVPVFSFFLPLISTLSRRANYDPALEYLGRMCSPLSTNSTRTIELNISGLELTPSLANSPFPCEQALYLVNACTANGTTEIDFLAEQEW